MIVANSGAHQYLMQKEGKSTLGKFIFLALIIIILTSILLLILSNISNSEHNLEIVEHKIESGQTIWSIAEMYYGNNIDLRKPVYHIIKVNNLNSALIKPGQKLKLPLNLP